ncbi:MAG: HD domain-containing protein [Lachnospiraceae bacterium]|nr:HD domain-containing protein [Lachnospiraceae bacterium]
MQKTNRSIRNRRIAIALCILINVVIAFLTSLFKLPMYFDTIGTIAIASMTGLFPGILVAVITNLLCGFFNEYALYYSIINVLIAIVTAWFVRYKKYEKILWLFEYVLVLAAISGILGTAVQWVLMSGPQFDDVAEAAAALSQKTNFNYFISATIVNIGLSFVDKTITVFCAFFCIRFIPEEKRKAMWASGWKQTPLTDDVISTITEKRGMQSVRGKMGLLISAVSVTLVLVMSWISINEYYKKTMEQYTTDALNATRLAAEFIDGDSIELYLRKGESAPGYQETKNLLYKIRDNATGVKYLYVLKISKKEYTFVFDLDTDDEPGNPLGYTNPIEEAFEPILTKLLAGEEIDPIESDDTYGWLLTTYYPVKNSAGKTVCYVGADVSMSYLSDYTIEFLVKSLIIFAGFFILVYGYALSASGYSLVYPLSTITMSAKDFVENIGDQKSVDKSVKNIRAMNIHTGDEVEELYLAICRMEANMAEQIRDIRHYADATAKMQNGLIITMADMVESRDSDTGSHVQKTAAYVKIILKGLKKKGYYESKLTAKYMADVEMSAPLHDVGKINISDVILNKPGKLTDEEYEIMKTHTTAGKEIMENAISTVEGENYLKEARNMAAYHHERWDGKGYPEGLHGEVIPLSARVMAVADVFDALTSARIYKPAFPIEKALEILQEDSGTQFDPKCVEVFMDSLPEVKQVLRKYNRPEL